MYFCKKRTMKKLILILIVYITGYGCITKERCLDKFPTKDSTTIIKTVEYRDTTAYIEIKPDTIFSEDTVYIKDGLFYSERDVLENDFSISIAEFKLGVLRHDLIQKDTTIARLIKNAVKEAKTTIEVKKEVVVEVEKKLKWWQTALMGVGGVSLFFVLFYVLVRIVFKRFLL